MKVELKKRDVFVPEWNGNKEQPEEEQIKFHHKYLGAARRKEFIYTKPLRFSSTKQNEQVAEAEYVQDGKGIALEVTEKIENLNVSVDGADEVAITDIKTFYKYALSDLAAEYEAYLISCNALADTKNLK